VPLAILPDAELVATAYLRGHEDVAPIVGARVYTELPESPVYPLLRVQRVGGVTRVPRRLDSARMQVEAWATTKQAARDLAATAHAALWDAGGHTVEGAVITGVEDVLGLTWFADPVTHRPRYLFDVVLLTHPA